jgi:hypothetical protein
LKLGILLTFSILLLKANSPQWQPSMPPAQQLNAPQAPWRCDYNIEGD